MLGSEMRLKAVECAGWMRECGDEGNGFWGGVGGYRVAGGGQRGGWPDWADG